MTQRDSILISGGTVVDPSQGMHARRDVLIEEGRIAAVAEHIATERARRTIDASGLFVCPGFIDLHCHLREPGGSASETIASGSAAAAAGGFTTVFCMPNTNPVCDSPVVVKYILVRSREAASIRVIPVAAVTRDQKGEQLADLGALKAAGAGAFSDDGRPVSNAMVMRRALTYAHMLDMPVFDHAEDLSLTADGVMHEGNISLRLGLKGIPRSSEATIVARDCALSYETGGRLHICHVSNRDSVAAIRHWKARGAPVTAEVSPHHLTLTDEAVCAGEGYRTDAKMKPPLCSEDDRKSLIEALEDGTLDCIATDHAPHSPPSKDALFQDAPFGIIGFESAFAVLYTGFVALGRWTLDFLIDKLTKAPADVLGAEWGTLGTGSPADVTLLKLGEEFVFDLSRVRSLSRNSPWIGKPCSGRVVATLAEGRPVFTDHGAFPAGLFVARSMSKAGA
ncbi:MAG: dihydroorotase [Phycisphaerae bacterium]|nr:dihydroorotase [Phycisphaerae bacterium]